MENKISIKQEIKQTQKLVITPQLRLAIKIMYMNRLDLEQTIYQELEKNPMLELDQRSNEPDEKENEEKLPEIDELSKKLEEAFHTYIKEHSFFPERGRRADEEEDEFDPIQLATASESLEDHLAWQLRMDDFSPEEVEIGEEIIGNLNDDGYLIVNPSEIAQKLGVSEEQVENVRKRIMQFDPPGVGALNIKECLESQLIANSIGDEVERRMVTEFFEHTVKREIKVLQEKLHVDEERVWKAIERISRLDPKPGRNYVAGPSQFVIPDLKVIEKEDGFDVVLVDEKLPPIMISPNYKKFIEFARTNKDKTLEKFLQEHYKRAKGIIQGIEQRNQTLLKVGKCIVEFQKEFLKNGAEHMKPLTLKDVHEVTGLHESTISRITSNKYIDTPWGIFPLKRFFSGKLDVDSGESISSTAVKEKIRRLIENENPSEPLSDHEIACRLKREGINIARRTVAKYREQMGIPSSTERKRQNREEL